MIHRELLITQGFVVFHETETRHKHYRFLQKRLQYRVVNKLYVMLVQFLKIKNNASRKPCLIYNVPKLSFWKDGTNLTDKFF